MDNKIPKIERAVVAGGCFWCMEATFDTIPGVISVTSGYTGGHDSNPTYEKVSTKMTGHLEAIEIIYNASQITYEELLMVFWANIDPTDRDGQFFDRGEPYHTAIFYVNEDQKDLATKTKAIVAEQLGQPVATQIRAITPFYIAEEYHQGFHTKSSNHYQRYKEGSGRLQKLKKLWKKD